MRRLLPICLLALSAAALLPAAPASSKRGASTPSITRVTPMRISIGNLLTIRGRNFKPRRNANTIIFRGPNGRSSFAKPRRAGRGKLVLVVPAGVTHLLAADETGQHPTRLKLRVLAGRFSDFTPPRLSPVVTAAGQGDGPPPAG
jgi:IPT/TIG domain